MTDITTQANGQHHKLPPVEYREPTTTGVKEIIESIQEAYNRLCREADQKDNLIEVLRDALAEKNEKLESYMRKTYEMAQQMKAVAQLCEEGRRLADIVDRG